MRGMLQAAVTPLGCVFDKLTSATSLYNSQGELEGTCVCSTDLFLRGVIRVPSNTTFEGKRHGYRQQQGWGHTTCLDIACVSFGAILRAFADLIVA